MKKEKNTGPITREEIEPKLTFLKLDGYGTVIKYITQLEEQIEKMFKVINDQQFEISKLRVALTDDQIKQIQKDISNES